MRPASEQRVERGEELREFLREHDVTFAVTKILDARLVRSLANVLDEQLLEPVDSVENERFEVVRLSSERVHGSSDVVPLFRIG